MKGEIPYVPGDVMTPLLPAAKAAGAVSGLPFAAIGDPISPGTITTRRLSPHTELPPELTPPVRFTQKTAWKSYWTVRRDPLTASAMIVLPLRERVRGETHA